MRSSSVLTLAVAAFPALCRAQTDFVVPAGTTLVYDTASGPIHARDVRIEAGATLRVVGAFAPLRIEADALLRIDGTLELSGADGESVGPFQSGLATLPTSGGAGGPVGGRGGFGNPNTNTWSERGGSALAANGYLLGFRAEGGETGYGGFVEPLNRGAGGGGGAFGPDAPLVLPPTAPQNLGRVAFDGHDGTGVSAVTHVAPARGGAKTAIPFVDANPSNDFFGRALDPTTGVVTVGELLHPQSGASGAGGGGEVASNVFPPAFPWSSGAIRRGGAGGGGGGAGILIARRIEIGSGGHVLANGGRGGAGESSIGLDRVAGGGGGGSGGMLALEARTIDLSQATPGALQALGGRGGAGANDVFDATGAGGNGGPGLIQLHVPPITTSLVLPSGVTLADLSAPTAKVLLPEPGL